jgi:hypothetical protein
MTGQKKKELQQQNYLHGICTEAYAILAEHKKVRKQILQVQVAVNNNEDAFVCSGRILHSKRFEVCDHSVNLDHVSRTCFVFSIVSRHPLSL